MAAPHPVIDRFYAAVHDADTDRLLATLTEDFVGHVTAGLPVIGGTHRGPSAMLRDAWVHAYATYRAVPHPEDFVVGADGRVVVLGHYRGRPPSTGLAFDAAFAHVFALHGDRIVELTQVTDSHRWVSAAAPEASVVAVVTRLFDAVRHRDLELLLGVYAEDVVIEEDPALPYGGTYRGHDGAVDHASGFVTAWDALQDGDRGDPCEQAFPSGDTAVALWTLRAAKDGRELAQPAASVITVADGKVASLRMLYGDVGAAARFLDE